MSKFKLTLTKDRYSHTISPLKWYFYSKENSEKETYRIAVLDKVLFSSPIPLLFHLTQFYCTKIFILNEVAMEIMVRSGINMTWHHLTYFP